MLKLTDLRKTTRRSGNGRTLHPHFLRDRSLAPRIEMAIRYLDSMLDRPRRELDQEAIVQLFGDHKIARCIVACLATSYRYRCRSFAEVLPVAQVTTLNTMGITNPSKLRLWLFRRANIELPGFAGGAERALFLRQAGNALGIAAEDIEMLLALDSPEQAFLVRTGPPPTADDVIARFNYQVTAAVLANAPIVRITLTQAPRDAATIGALCAVAGVHAELAGRELVLYGQQDVRNGWARYGTRIARLLTSLLACGLPAGAGEALVAAPHGEPWRFHLSAETLSYLGLGEHCGQELAPAEVSADFAAADLLACWRAQDALMADYAAIRRAEAHIEWTLRRATAPLVLDEAILPTLFVATRGAQRVPLVLAPASATGVARLAEVAARLPLVALRVATDTSAAEARATATAPNLLSLTYRARGDLARLPALLTRAVDEVEQRGAQQQLAAVFTAARADGVLTEQQLAMRLGHTIADLPVVLARPEALALAARYEIRYVEGFGLCSTEMLERAHGAVRDIAGPPGRANGVVQITRMLSRRLREVTGASEGIECLIAYLGAASAGWGNHSGH